MMETIRVTPDEQRRIGAAAKASPQKNKQRFCLAAIMEKVEAHENRPIPEGCIRLYPFEGVAIDIARNQYIPKTAAFAMQYQVGGMWYFMAEDGRVVGTMLHEEMAKFMTTCAPTLIRDPKAETDCSGA